MKVSLTPMEGVFLIEPVVHDDSRGFFMESYHADRYKEHNIPYTFIQDNHSLSVDTGVLRGLHYQLSPKAQTKLIRVICGAIFAVIVDIRKSSPTYKHWQGFDLSADNHKQLLVPRGFANGFCTLAPHTEVLYKVDEYYSPELERGIIWNDRSLAIEWPINNPVLSAKDLLHPVWAKAEIDFE